MRDQKTYDKTKASMLNWQQLKRQAKAAGDDKKAKVYREYALGDLRHLRVLKWNEPPTFENIRFDDRIPVPMIPVGPHQTVSKNYYDRYMRRSQIEARPNANGGKTLSGSQTG